jgi:hypothetical protein
VPERKIPEPPKRGSLQWRVLARRKFFWERGEIRLVHPVKDKDAPGRASNDPREDGGGPGTGRG